VPVLSLADPHLYDCPDGGTTDGGLVDASRPGYRQVAAWLREKILSGELRPGAALPAHSALAAEHGVSQATISAAVGQLADEGLVRVEHGRPTVVLARHSFRVAVEIARPEDDQTRDASAFASAVAASAVADQATSAVEASLVDDRAVKVILIVTAPTPGKAAMIAESVVWSARGKWSWDGFSAAWSIVTAGPAGG
jgi:DNA-binding GntR family transcriptional regulator